MDSLSADPAYLAGLRAELATKSGDDRKAVQAEIDRIKPPKAAAQSSR